MQDRPLFNTEKTLKLLTSHQGLIKESIFLGLCALQGVDKKNRPQAIKSLAISISKQVSNQDKTSEKILRKIIEKSLHSQQIQFTSLLKEFLLKVANVNLTTVSDTVICLLKLIKIIIHADFHLDELPKEAEKLKSILRINNKQVENNNTDSTFNTTFYQLHESNNDNSFAYAWKLLKYSVRPREITLKADPWITQSLNKYSNLKNLNSWANEQDELSTKRNLQRRKKIHAALLYSLLISITLMYFIKSMFDINSMLLFPVGIISAHIIYHINTRLSLNKTSLLASLNEDRWSQAEEITHSSILNYLFDLKLIETVDLSDDERAIEDKLQISIISKSIEEIVKSKEEQHRESKEESKYEIEEPIEANHAKKTKYTKHVYIVAEAHDKSKRSSATYTEPYINKYYSTSTMIIRELIHGASHLTLKLDKSIKKGTTKEEFVSFKDAFKTARIGEAGKCIRILNDVQAEIKIPSSSKRLFGRRQDNEYVFDRVSKGLH